MNFFPKDEIFYNEDGVSYQDLELDDYFNIYNISSNDCVSKGILNLPKPFMNLATVHEIGLLQEYGYLN